MNLLTNPWIPTTSGALGLLETLERSRDLQITLEGTQWLAVQRLLLAVCYQGEESSVRLLRRGVGSRTLRALERVAPQFDLVDGYLTCADLTAKVYPHATICADLPSGYTMSFHHHTRDDRPMRLSEAQLAVRIVEFQSFAPSGGNSVTGYRSLSPCADVVFGIAVGENLLETLALNLVPDHRAASASWTRPEARAADFLSQTRDTAASVAEQYTWLAQAVRLHAEGVGTARGFRLVNTVDPMMTVRTSKRQDRLWPLQPSGLEPWLLACQALGMGTAGTEVLRHAATLGVPHRVRVVAQSSSARNKVKVLERIDATYALEHLSLELGAVVWKCRQKLAKVSTDLARSFVSTLEDRITEQSGAFHFEDFWREYTVSTRVTRFQNGGTQ